MEHVRADIVFFTDANVTFSRDAIQKIIPYFADSEIGCVCGCLQYTNLHEGATANIGGFYWRFEEYIKQLESETGNVMGADGSIFAIRRELYSQIPQSTLPDMFISFEVLFKGYRIIHAKDVVAYERSATAGHDEFRRKVRIACRAFNFHRDYWSRLTLMSAWDQYKYFSHKFIRWFSFLWFILAASLTSGLILGVIGLGVFLVTAPTIIWFGLRYEIPIVSQSASIASAMFATFIGIIESLLGKRYISWHPAKTSR